MFRPLVFTPEQCISLLSVCLTSGWMSLKILLVSLPLIDCHKNPERRVPVDSWEMASLPTHSCSGIIIYQSTNVLFFLST